MPCCINVSYPQLRELKGAEPMFQYVLDDVSYPQLRELKAQARRALEQAAQMYLTRSCGN